MAGALDNIVDIIQQITSEQFKYMVPRLGQVVDLTDPLGKGRINVTIPSLGWDTADKGAWCWSRDKNSLITPALNDWVMVQWMDGQSEFPVYSGVATEMFEMLPDAYDGNNNTYVIFEEPSSEKIKLVYNAISDILEIGKSGFSEAARKEDEVKSTSVEDSTFWTWLVTTLVTTFNTHTHVESGATTAPPLPSLAAAPSDLTGKITAGSSQVKIGDK